MQVDGNELCHNCPENVEHSPLFAVYLCEVELSRNLVDVVELINREVLKSGVLSSLAVNFEEYMFVS